MKSQNSSEILWSPGNNDECWTPEYGVYPILKYIPKDAVVWCPFDTEDSNFVKLIKQNGNKVLHNHIKYGQNFYDYQPPEKWDVIISNPPFTNKRLIFERALSFNKPFALLMSLTWLNDSAPKKLFKDKDLELLMFDRRIKFNKPDGTPMESKITFSSDYYCWNLLPKQIICEEL